MVITKTLIKNSCTGGSPGGNTGKSPGEVFESVNKKLYESNETGMFVTAFIGFYNIKTRKLKFVNAGHNPPLLKKKGCSFEYLKTTPSLVLGFLEDVKYNEEEIYLEKGDVFFLYTDGITEAMNNQKELFGEQRLIEAANNSADAEQSIQELLSDIKHNVDNFAQGAEQSDDITMLALQITDNKEELLEKRKYFRNNKEIKITASVSNLDSVIEFIGSALEISDCPHGMINEICVAVEEIFINIANYAYEKDIGDVLINISISEKKAVIRFEDFGHPYNPAAQPDPDLEKSLEDRQIGGLGVFMVKNLMDSLEYLRVNDKNVLVLTKKF